MNNGIRKAFAAGIAGAFAALLVAAVHWAGELGSQALYLGQRAVGIAGWGLVAAGFLGVAVAMGAGGPRRPQTLLVREPLQPPEKVVHSGVYTPPPYRRHYQSSRSRR